MRFNLKAIKRRIATYLLLDEVVELQLQADKALAFQLTYDQNIAEFEAYKRSLTIVDLVREQLKGFDPKRLDRTRTFDSSSKSYVTTFHELPDIFASVDGGEDSFLAKCKSLDENDALPIIVEFLIRNQILFSSKEALNLDDVNFGRATVNGLSLLREEIARLATLFRERHAEEPEFDEHEVLST